MISLLVPSRGRPESLDRMMRSAVDTANNEVDVEIIVAVDRDDPKLQEYLSIVIADNLVVTERTVLSQYWNLAYEKAKGPIYMHCADDLVFHTQDWDTKVKEAFDQYEDKIVFVHGDDGNPNRGKEFGTHGFLHKNWVEAVGYFVPPHYTSDFNDTHLNEVADMIGRKHYADILTEHMHPGLGKAEMDLTHAERLVRHFKDDMPALYASKENERKGDAEKLRKVMHE